MIQIHAQEQDEQDILGILHIKSNANLQNFINQNAIICSDSYTLKACALKKNIKKNVPMHEILAFDLQIFISHTWGFYP